MDDGKSGSMLLVRILTQYGYEWVGNGLDNRILVLGYQIWQTIINWLWCPYSKIQCKTAV